jgi:hypothetical protein
MAYLGGPGEYFEKLSFSDMTSEKLEEMLKGDSADTRAEKFLLVSMGGQADTSSVRRRGARTPISASGNVKNITFVICHIVISSL